MVEDIIRENRICPKPMVWKELYEIMCKDLNENNIPKPLILAGWNFSSDIEKRNRFIEHLKLIDFNSENKIKTFVLNIREEDWYKS
jgi:hypothetical protein